MTLIVRTAAPSADAEQQPGWRADRVARSRVSQSGTCITCHNQRTKALFGNLALDTLDVSRVGPAAETWEKAVKKIRTGMMPPSGARRPERAALDRFASELESRLDRAVDATAALAKPALHRLNRTEYPNAIRDLLALDVNVNTLLPADGSSQGFDNLAEALAVSPR